MKRKEVEDVMGGKAAWDNVDKTDGMTGSLSGYYILREIGRDGKRILWFGRKH